MGWLLFATAIGACGVAWSDAGLTTVRLPEEDDDATRERLLARSGEAGPAEAHAPGWVQDAVTRAREHLAGRPQDLRGVPLDVSRLTPFVVKVLRAAQAIPAGRTATYGELAGAVGSPGASRAIGRAMATNAWPLIVPCHRVVAASGGSGGLFTKERILRIEGATLLADGAAKQIALFDSPPETFEPRPLRKLSRN